MAIYNQGKIAGIVGYEQLYPDKAMPRFESLLNGLSRLWAVRLVSNMQNKLVGKPFYNPSYQGSDDKNIDVARFFFGDTIEDRRQVQDIIHRYKSYYAYEVENHQQPMEFAAGSETPLLLLKHIMAMPEQDATDDIGKLKREFYTAFMVANEMTMNRNQGEPPYKEDDDLELYLSSLLMSRYAYNDFTNQQTDLEEQVRNQISRTTKFFRFVRNHPQLTDLYDEFLQKYELTSWNDYLRTYWSVQALARYKTGIVNFEKLEDEDGLLSEQIVDKDSIDIHQIIPLEENVDYVAFREKPFIKIAPHEYAVIDVSFMVYRMFDGLYFIFNNLWQRKHEDDPNGFNRIFTTEFSEETVFVDSLKDVADTHGWLSLTDQECKAIIPEKNLSAPPDFYIRDGKDVILFECKDVKIPKEIKAEGTTKQLLEEVDKDFVGYQEGKRWRYKGVGQLVRNAKRIQDGLFAWDQDASRDSRIFLVLVLADSRQVAAGWKNYLNKKMFDECQRQKVDFRRVCPLLLADLGTLTLYRNNFKKYGFLSYFVQYYNKTNFDERKVFDGDMMTNIMNQTLSFSGYMTGERLLGGEELRKDVMGAIAKRADKQGQHSYVTKTVEYSDLFEDKPQEAETYLKGINKRWLIEGVVHMISVDSFDSFSMGAERGLLVMFQNYRTKREVIDLFRQLKRLEDYYEGTWLTLINHQALFRLLRKVLMMPNERAGVGESYEAYEALLKAILVENRTEMKREKEILSRIEGEPDIRDAIIIMQQDVLNLDLFGENKKELEKAQMLKYLALCDFGKKHQEVGDAIKRVVKKNGFENEFSYLLLAQMPLSVYYDKDNFKEGLYFLRRSDYEETKALQLWNEFVNFVSDKCIDVWDTERMVSLFTKQEVLDNTCFRKNPVLKMSEEEYLLVSQPYYTHLLYDGFWWSVKEELGKDLSDKAVMNLLTKVFSEKQLFCRLVEQMIGDKRIRIYNDYCFDAQQPAPDFAIKTRHHLFLFEYKDMRVQRKVSDGGDMNLLMDFVDDRLNKNKSEGSGNHGIPQLVSNMEDFFGGKRPWKEFAKKGNIIIIPILVINSRLFGVRGIGYLMQKKMSERIMESEILRQHVKEIGELLVVDYDMLILVASRCYKSTALFHRILYSYQTHVRKATDMVTKSESYRHYVMNKWEREMTERNKKVFEHSYKKVIRKVGR